MMINFLPVDHLMHDAVTCKCFPGAVVLVSEHGKILLHRAYGVADIFDGRPMSCDTIFDLASLTKPLGTTMAVMLLAQQGMLSIDQPCHLYCPGFQGSGKEKITIRHLLCHCSGLPAWRPYYLSLSAAHPQARTDLMQRAIMAEPLSAAPGERTDYSDLGFMVLQGIVESITGRGLDHYLQTSLFRPLGLETLFFIDHTRHKPQDRFQYAATELCPLRGKLLLGEVHDDNAHWVGGVAGHAGLFGTAAAVWSLLQGLLTADAGLERHALFERGWVQRFFERQIGSSWALGFDTPSKTASSAGHLFSDESVGHLGYTGTSFWIDRARGIIVILLTNRVHPSRYNARIKAFRPRLHDVVMEAVIGSDESNRQAVR